MGGKKLKKKIAESCDRHALSTAALEVVSEWVERAIIQQILLQNLEDGYVEVCGVNSAGEVVFKIADGNSFINNILEN